MTLRTHGITRDPVQLTQQPGPWYYEMQMLGFNYRMTDFQAALGRSQFKKLDGFVKRRRELVARYNDAFADIPWITTPWEEPGRETAWHLYVVQFNWDAIGMDRPTVMARLREQGIGTQVLYIPVPDQPYYKEHYRYPDSAFSNAKSYYDNALAIPLYPAMTEDDQERVVEAIRGLS